MLISIMRHGLAVERGHPDYPDDAARPLTRKGARRIARIVRGLRRLDLSIDRILSSPHYRCRQTADIAAAELQLPPTTVVDSKNLMPGANPIALVQDLFNQPMPNSVLVVGHQPELTELISLLITGDVHAVDVPMKKGAVALVECDNPPTLERGTLHFLMQPAMLRRLSK